MGHGGSRELSDLVSIRARTSQLLATSQGNDHFSFVEKPLKAFFLLLVRDRIQGTSRGSVFMGAAPYVVQEMPACAVPSVQNQVTK